MILTLTAAMYHCEVCNIRVVPHGRELVYVVTRQNGSRGFYWAPMVKDERPWFHNPDGSPGRPEDGPAMVRFEPNRIRVFHPATPPRLAADDSDDEWIETDGKGEIEIGMTVVGQFYDRLAFRIPISDPHFSPFEALRLDRPHIFPCLAAAAAPATPVLFPAPPVRERRGNPCREFVDDMGRPLLSVSFPMLSDRPARSGNLRFVFDHGRMEDEQRLVAFAFNQLHRFDAMHGSHLARHGHCGSPWRTNLTPTSATCNQQLIREFEDAVLGRLRECYTAREINLADSRQDVLAYVVHCYYRPKMALAWLVGAGNVARVLEEREAGTPRAVALTLLAHYLPGAEVRQLLVGRGGQWRPLYSQVHDIQAIMFGAGNPLDGRYDFNELDDRWGMRVTEWLSRGRFHLRCEVDRVVANEALFDELANITGFPSTRRRPACPASEYLRRTTRHSDVPIPFIDRGVLRLREEIHLLAPMRREWSPEVHARARDVVGHIMSNREISGDQKRALLLEMLEVFSSTRRDAWRAWLSRESSLHLG